VLLFILGFTIEMDSSGIFAILKFNGEASKHLTQQNDENLK
jgi:hypothetical protein